MKSINKTVLILISIIFSTQIFAGNIKIDNKKLKRKIGAHISFPEFAKQNNLYGEVAVKVIVDDSGKLKVEDANGHPKLMEYVKSKIESIKINDDKNVGDCFLYKIVFEKQA